MKIIEEEVIEKIKGLASKEAGDILLFGVEKLSKEEYDLKEIETEIRRRILSLGRSILEQALTISGSGYVSSIIPCSCKGGKMRFVENRKKVITTLLNDIEVFRAYYYCSKCGRGWIPLDEKLEIEGTGFSPGVREALALVDAEVSFERGSLLLERLIDIRISKQRGQIISEDFGEEIGCMYKEIEDKIMEDKEIKKDEVKIPQQLYISTDGTKVNTEEGWKEVKVGAIFNANLNGDKEPIREETTYLGGFQDSEKFGKRLYSVAVQQGLENAKEVIVIGDGAKWIWTQADTHFHGAVQIVDWYHAVSKLLEVSDSVYGEGKEEGRLWLDRCKEKLKDGNVEGVILLLKGLNVFGKESIEKIKEAIGYFENNKERMRYNYFRDKGYFIGSGVVEASCKHVVADRLKKSGMRWSVKGANAILQLRVCILNHQWNSFYQWRRGKYKMAA